MFKLFVWKLCYRGGQTGSKKSLFDRCHLCMTPQVSWNFNKIRLIPPKSKLLPYSFFGCQHKIQRWMLNIMKHKMMMIYHHILISLNFFHSFVQKHKKRKIHFCFCLTFFSLKYFAFPYRTFFCASFFPFCFTFYTWTDFRIFVQFEGFCAWSFVCSSLISLVNIGSETSTLTWLDWILWMWHVYEQIF